MNFRYAQPVQNIRHQCLEPHILNTSNQLCALEVFVCRVSPSLSEVIHKVLGHFTEGSTLLTEVNNNTNTTTLCCLHTFFNCKGEIRFASTNVGSKDIGSVTCIKIGTLKSNFSLKRIFEIKYYVHSSCTRSVSSLVSSRIYSGGPTKKRQESWFIHEHIR